MTWRPAPRANSVSVAVADSETIRVGRLAIVTWPLAASTVIGNFASAALGAPQARTVAASTAPARALLDMKNLRVSGGRWLGGGAARTSLPPRGCVRSAWRRRPGSSPDETGA